ncbi:MAG: hypothetical protein ACYTAF_02600 [Planctomycetota bacterium]|jgi:hypothetical protein
MNRAFAVAVAFSVVLALAACSGGYGTFEESYNEIVHDGIETLNLHLDQRDFNMIPLTVFQETSLSRMIANPQSFLRMNVEFTAMMKQHDEDLWEAYYTSMSQERFYNFSVWPIGAKLWTENGFASSLDTLYVHKENPFFDDILEVQPFEIFLIRGRVISDFKDRPWIECLYIYRLDSPVYSGPALEELVRGAKEQEDECNAAAISSLESAATGTMPDEAMFDTHYRIGVLYAARGAASRDVKDYEAAIANFSTALGYDGSHVGAQKALKQAEMDLERQQQIDKRKAEEEQRAIDAKADRERQIEREQQKLDYEKQKLERDKKRVK